MPALTRRSFIAASVAAGTALSRPAAAAAPEATMQGPGAYRYKLGDYPVDRALRRHLVSCRSTTSSSAMRPRRTVNDALAAAFLPPSVLPISFTALLVNTGAKLVLIDTGTAGQITDTAGVMNDNLAARRHRAGSDRHHPDLAFPSRPHRRHQDQGRRQGVPPMPRSWCRSRNGRSGWTTAI